MTQPEIQATPLPLCLIPHHKRNGEAWTWAAMIKHGPMSIPDEHTLLFDQLCHFLCPLSISEHKPLGSLLEKTRHNIAYLKDISDALKESDLDPISKYFSSTWIYLKFKKTC